MATISPELILASYSCARRDHMVRLMRARPFSELAHADRDDLGGRNPQGHLVLDEVDDKQFQLGAGDFLLLNCNDLAHAVGGINDKLVGLKRLSLGSLFIGDHS